MKCRNCNSDIDRTPKGDWTHRHGHRGCAAFPGMPRTGAEPPPTEDRIADAILSAAADMAATDGYAIGDPESAITTLTIEVAQILFPESDQNRTDFVRKAGL